MFFTELRSFKKECPTISGFGGVVGLWLIVGLALYFAYAAIFGAQ